MLCKALIMSVGTSTFAYALFQESIQPAKCRVQAIVSFCCCAGRVLSGELQF